MKTFTSFRVHILSVLKLFLIVILFLPFSIFAQQTNYLESWVTTGGTADNFFNNIVSVINNTNDVYIAASEQNTNGGYDLLLSKVDKFGNEYWSTSYNLTLTGDAIAGAITLDGNENIIVTGTAFNGANNYDLFVVKYNSTGTQQWSKTYNGAASFYDGGRAVVCDDNNNVYVTGGSFENIAHSDMVTIAYNPSGIEQWIKHYDGNNLNDGGATIGLFNSNIVISGPIQSSPSQWSYAAVQYNITSGAELFSASTIGSNMDEFTALAIDNNENIYITGSVKDPSSGFFDYKTFKLDSNLQILWEVTYNGVGDKDDMAKAVGVDDSGNVYVTGFTTNSNGSKDYLTIKYNGNGTSEWTKKYDGGADDEAVGLVVNEDNDVFVTGYSSKSGKQDYFTILYDENNGAELWSSHYNGVYNKNDVAKKIELDEDGSILVSGQSETPANTTYLTVKYSKHEIIIPPDDELTSIAYSYVENRGQLRSTDEKTVPDVKFYNKEVVPSIYCFNEKISLVVNKVDSSDTTLDTMFRVDLSFIERGERRGGIVAPLNAQKDYFNFYLEHITEGRENVSSFKDIIYPNVFSNVDLMLSSNRRSTKYYFIIKPGAAPEDILMNFTGQNGLSTTNNDLNILTSISDITFSQPSAYQIDGSGNKIPLGWAPNYLINGDEVSFSLGTYNVNQPLVFQVNQTDCSEGTVDDDNNDWATYYTGAYPISNKNFLDIDTDNNNSVCITGFTLDEDFPEVDGEFVDHFGNEDGVLIKLRDDGTREWTTYFGSSGVDFSKGVAIDEDNQIYIIGESSSGNIPLLDNGIAFHDSDRECTLTACGEMFIARFSPQGIRQFATYYGNGVNIAERGHDIKINSKGEVFICGHGGAHVLDEEGNVYSNSTGRGILAKFNSQFEELWGTQIGGSAIEEDVVEISFDSQDNLFLTGITRNSNEFPIVSPDPSSYTQDFGGGDFDLFIQKFSSFPHDLTWSTFYGGSGNEANSVTEFWPVSILVDNKDEVYLAGKTPSSDMPAPNFPTPAPGALYDPTYNGGSGDGFYAKFTNEGVPIIASYFGGSSDDSFVRMTKDARNNIYFVGATSSNSLTTASPLSNLGNNYYLQQNPGGGFGPDALIAVINENLEPEWITFYGGTGAETGQSTTISDNNKLYIAGIVTRNMGQTGEENGFPLEDLGEALGNEAYYQCDWGEITDFGGGLYFSRFSLNHLSTSSIEVLENTDKLSIYPNPANDFINIKYESDLNEKVDIQIYDVLGRNVLTKTINEGLIQSNSPIDISKLLSGIYFVSISIDNKSYSTTFLKH